MFRRITSVGTNKTVSSSSPPVPDGATKFTLPHLKNLHKVLVENKDLAIENEKLVVEVLRVLAEMVVYGDSKSELLFDFFCEKNMLSLFLEIMRSSCGCPPKVYIQILQTLSILCQCVRNDTSLYYLLSNNYINDIIRFPYNFEEDELSDIFISFMKSLSLRLNSQTVQFFFIEESGTFPLLSRAIEFLKYRDPMVRTGAQSTILNIFKIEDIKARQYSLKDDILLSFATEVVGQLEAHHNSIQSLCIEYNLYAGRPNTKEFTEGRMGERIEHQVQGSLDALEDWLYYLQDLFGLNVRKLTRFLSRHIVAHYIYPVLLDPLLRYTQVTDPRRRPETTSSNVERGDVAEQEGAEEISVTPLPSVETTEYKDTPSTPLSPAADTNDDEPGLCITVALFLLIQTFRTVKEKQLRRALKVALFHPVSEKHRKNVLFGCEGSNMATSESLDPNRQCVQSVPEISAYDTTGAPSFLNPYREALVRLMGSGADRIVLLSCLLIDSVVRQDVSSCAPFLAGDTGNFAMGAAATASVLKPLELLEIWDPPGEPVCKTSLSVDDFPVPETLPTTTVLCGDDNAESRLKNDINNALDAEGMIDYKGEMDEYTYGSEAADPVAIRGRSGSAEMNPEEDIPSCDADTLSVADMMTLSATITQLSEISGNGAELPDDLIGSTVSLEYQRGIFLALLNLLQTAHKRSLPVLQVAAVTIYDLVRMAHIASKAAPSTDTWTCPDKIMFCLRSVRQAVKTTAEALLARANGWLSDTLLGQLEEEIRRAAAAQPKWEATLQKMSSDVVLVLPPTTHLFQRIGTDHSIPTSEVEKARREVQMFLLLRSLFRCILKLSKSSSATSSAEDLSKGLIDGSVSEFSEYAGVPDKYAVGNSIAMGGRHCFASCVVSPLFDPSEFAKSGRLSFQSTNSAQNTPTSSRRSSLSPAVSRGKLTPLGGRRSSTGGSPALVENNSPKPAERPRKVGEVYFIYDEITTLLLSVPLKKLDSEAAVDGDDERNIKLLVRSSLPLQTMDRVGQVDTSVGVSNSSTFAHGDSNGAKLASILPSRSPGTLYQMIIGFETKKHCDAAAKHIETCRLRVKSTRMDSLRSILQMWTSSGTDIDESC